MRKPTKRARAAGVLGGGALAVGGLAVFAGAGVAGAAASAPGTGVASRSAPVAVSAGLPALGQHQGLLFQLSCEDLQKVEDWIVQKRAIISADATVRGSTLWVQAKLAEARAAGNTKRVEHLQRVLDRRAAHPDLGAKLLARVQRVELAKSC